MTIKLKFKSNSTSKDFYDRLSTAVADVCREEEIRNPDILWAFESVHLPDESVAPTHEDFGWEGTKDAAEVRSDFRDKKREEILTPKGKTDAHS